MTVNPTDSATYDTDFSTVTGNYKHALARVLVLAKSCTVTEHGMKVPARLTLGQHDPTWIYGRVLQLVLFHCHAVQKHVTLPNEIRFHLSSGSWRPHRRPHVAFKFTK